MASYLYMRGRFAGIIRILCVVGGILSLVLAGRTAYRGYLVRAHYAAAPAGMVLVPAGYFLMGSNDSQAELDERPMRRVFLPAFYIDAHEITNREYKRFKPDHTYPEGQDDLPVTHVFKPEAEAYARFVGKRLPTNAEWEKAARGTDGRQFPWGDRFETNRANLDPTKVAKAMGLVCLVTNNPAHFKTAPGSFPLGASPYGAQDMAGNVWEWVSDNHRDSPWLEIFGEHRTERGIIRGGGYAYSPFQARTSHQAFEALNTTCNDVGFRCALSARPSP